MKKVGLIFISLLVLVLGHVSLPVHAETNDENSFPYIGLYITNKDDAIRGYYFEEDRVYILYTFGHREEDKSGDQRVIKYMNMDIELPLSYLNPTISSEEIAAKRKELGLDLSYSEVLKDIAKDLPEDATPEDVELMIDQRIPSFKLGIGNSNFPYPLSTYFKVAQPDIQKIGEEWVLKFLGERLFSIKDGEEIDTIRDDYDKVYYRVTDQRTISDIQAIPDNQE